MNLGSVEVVNCLESCGYAHFLAGAAFAPLDGVLFKYRRNSGSPVVPELTIASLLAKKVAVGLGVAGLDIRVAAHGNLGSNWQAARNNGNRFRRVAAICGLSASCFLTDARFPYQPFVGRGEALLAVRELFTGVASESVWEHALLCLRMAARTVDHHALPDLKDITYEAKGHFFANLRAQGGTIDSFDAYTNKIRECHRYSLHARCDGVMGVQLERLRDVILAFQRYGPLGDGFFPDGIGVILRVRPGTVVRRGDAVATVRVTENYWPAVERRMRDVFTTEPDDVTGRDFEEVR